MNDQIKEYAIKYQQQGFSPIPTRGKVAKYRWKEYQFNLQDFAKLGVNVGLRTGLLPSGDYFYVVDLDSKELLGSFYESHPELMCAPLVSTGRGWHIYMTWKEQVRTRHTPGIDIIANGYVLAPPSIHPNGHVYKFIVPLRGMPPTYNPEWLGMGITPPIIVPDPRSNQAECNGRYVQRQTDIYGPVSQGQRHNTLLSYLGFLHKAHFTEEEALVRALAWNKKCSPPETEQIVISTVRSCWGKWDIFKV